MEGGRAHPSRVLAVRPAGRARPSRLAPTLGLLAATFIYTLFATGGTWAFERSHAPFYDRLGEAFAAGQLHLTLTPMPELLALPNPYDPVQNLPFRAIDHSLYNGRYYLYFGPVPALFHAAWRLLTGAPLRDSVVGVGAALAASAAFWLILRTLRTRHFPRSPGWPVWGSTLAFAFGGVMLLLVGRPSIYHEAISVALAFLLFAWYTLLLAWESDAGRRRHLLWSGALLGCAVGSRITYLAYAIGPGLILLGALLRAGRGARRLALLDLASFGGPLALTLAALLLYNLARFDSPFEFGPRYGLSGSTWLYQLLRREDGTWGSPFSPAALVPNLVLYLFSLPKMDLAYPYFPFAGFPYVGGAFVFPDVSNYRASAIEPPLISVFLLAPVTLLALLTPRLLLMRPPAVPASIRKWAGSLLLGVLPMLVLLSSARPVSARYIADILPTLILLGSLFLLVHAAEKPGAGAVSTRALLGFATASWGVSLGLGLLLGLGIWIYTFGPEAVRAQATSNAWLGRLTTVLSPASVGSSTEPVGRTTWRSADGHYQKDAAIYLRLPAAEPRLFVDFTSHLPAGSELVITVDGAPVMRGPMLAGPQVWWTPPLATASPGAVVAVRLQLPSQDRLAPGSQLPLVVSGLRFARGPDQAELDRRSVRG